VAQRTLYPEREEAVRKLCIRYGFKCGPLCRVRRPFFLYPLTGETQPALLLVSPTRPTLTDFNLSLRD